MCLNKVYLLNDEVCDLSEVCCLNKVYLLNDEVYGFNKVCCLNEVCDLSEVSTVKFSKRSGKVC
jgi:hypothetical protein